MSTTKSIGTYKRFDENRILGNGIQLPEEGDFNQKINLER